MIEDSHAVNQLNLNDIFFRFWRLFIHTSCLVSVAVDEKDDINAIQLDRKDAVAPAISLARHLAEAKYLCYHSVPPASAPARRITVVPA